MYSHKRDEITDLDLAETARTLARSSLDLGHLKIAWERKLRSTYFIDNGSTTTLAVFFLLCNGKSDLALRLHLYNGTERLFFGVLGHMWECVSENGVMSMSLWLVRLVCNTQTKNTCVLWRSPKCLYCCNTHWGGSTKVLGWTLGLLLAEAPIWLADRFSDCWFNKLEAKPAWYCN